MQGTLAPLRTSGVQLTSHTCTLVSDSFDLTETKTLHQLLRKKMNLLSTPNIEALSSCSNLEGAGDGQEL